MAAALPDHLARAYDERRDAIRARLQEFSQVPRTEWFYELCFCLLTPQSKALHAAHAIERLKGMHFQEEGGDPTEILRDPAHYIRFHNTKARRLQVVRDQWPTIVGIISQPGTARERRDLLARTVNGMGMKEASHFLRNVGKRGLAIVDRHLLTNLIACRVLDEHARVTTYAHYVDIENRFTAYAEAVGIDMDELDLLFWSEMAGLILK